MYRVVLAEEQPAMRHAVRSLLDAEHYVVVGEVADGLEAYSQTLALKPDLLILALRLKRLGGLEVIRRLRRRRAKVKILVLTAADSEHFIGLCMQAGASGFVSKQDDLGGLLLALKAVAQGHTFFPGGAAAQSAGTLTEADQIGSLSPRELTVLHYLASGYANSAIAREMALSDRTVSTYKVRLFRKLNIRNLVELIDIAQRNDLLEPAQTVREGGAGAPAWDADGGQNALMRLALDAIPAGVSIRDKKGRLMFANDYLLRRYQRRREDLIGSKPSDFDLIDARDVAELEAIYADAVKLGVSFDREVVITYRGAVTTQRFWGVPLRDAQGETVSMVCGQWNLSEQETAFEHLREDKARADAARHASGALLSGHVRRANASLDALESALARLGTDAALSPSDRSALKEARDAAHALRLQHDMLKTWTDTRADSHATVSHPCELSRFAHDVAAALRERLAAQVSADVSGMRAPRVWMDEARCRPVIASLIAHVGGAFCCDRVELALHSAMRSRALVAVDIDIACSKEREPDTPGDDVGIDMARELCESIDAQLTMPERTATRLGLRVSMSLPKAAAA